MCAFWPGKLPNCSLYQINLAKWYFDRSKRLWVMLFIILNSQNDHQWLNYITEITPNWSINWHFFLKLPICFTYFSSVYNLRYWLNLKQKCLCLNHDIFYSLLGIKSFAMLQRGSYFRCPTELFNVTPYVTKICEKTFVWETFQPFTDQWLIGSFISIIVQKSSCYCRNIFSFTFLQPLSLKISYI